LFVYNGKTDPRMSTLVKLLTCYGRSLGDPEPRPAEVYSVATAAASRPDL
jgi:hypothetical protein